MTACAWCAEPFAPSIPGRGRPRRYCSVACRTAHSHYREDLPAWAARVAELEAAAAGYAAIRAPFPTPFRNELDGLRAAIAAGPAERTAPCRP